MPFVPVSGEINSQILNSNFSYFESQKIGLDDMGEYNILLYGGDNTGQLDNTQVFNSLVESVPEGSRIIFPSGVYLGNFITSKSLTLDFQDSKTIPADDNQPGVLFTGSEDLPLNVSETTLPYGSRSFTVTNASNLQAGDVGYLYDESTRPGDLTPKVNVELIKIGNITDNQITVLDMIRSDMNTGSIYFVKVNTAKNPRVLNVDVLPTETHYENGILFYGCENPYTQNVKVDGFSRHGVRHEFCYNPLSHETQFTNPRLVESGQGYGMTFKGCRAGHASNIYSEGCRHAVDMSGSYHCKVWNLSIPSSQSTPVILTHNGYGGFNEVIDATITFDGSAIVASKQGIADESKHTARGYKVKSVRHVIPTKDASEPLYSCYFQTDYSDIEVNDYDIHYCNTSVDPGPQSMGIRFNGNQKGPVVIENIRSNIIGSSVHVERRSTGDVERHLLTIDKISANLSFELIRLRGVINASIGSYKSSDVVSGGSLISIIEYYAKPYRISFDSEDVDFVGNNFNFSGFPVSGLRGKAPTFNEGSSSSLPLSDGGTIPSENIYHSGKFLRLDSGTTAPITLDAAEPIAPPMWLGQPLTLMVDANRENITIPVGGTFRGDTDLVLTADNPVTLKGYAQKWYVE